MTTKAAPEMPLPLTHFWQPRYWLVWVGLGCLRLAALLPVRYQLQVGRGLGQLLYALLPGRRHVAARNLDLCFPAMTPREREVILRGHFASLGMTLMEHGLAWWSSDALVRESVEVQGSEHLLAALATGRGVVLLTGHFGSQEFTGRVFPLFSPPVGVVYRPSKNPLIDNILRRIRGRSAGYLVSKHSLRRMIRLLRQGTPVWYAPDQSQGHTLSALIPFCGEPAMTTTALTEIARLGNALVVPVLPRRFPATGHYRLEIQPALTDFPGPSPEADAARVNALLETHIRAVPEQYYWVHRRFKGRPPPFPDPYLPDPPVR